MGIDAKPPASPVPGITFYKANIRDASTTEIICKEKPDCVIHLAFAVDFLRKTKEEQSVNIGGLNRVLAGVKASGCSRLVVTSSTVVYGAYQGIEMFQDEEDPTCIHPHLPYARDKVLSERICGKFSRENPDVGITIIRPAIVVGPNWGNLWAAVFFVLPFVPLINREDPSFQFIHEDDLVQIYRLAIEKGMTGTFNATADGAIPLTEIARMIGKPAIPIPTHTAKAAMWVLHHLRIMPVGSPPAVVDFFTYPWVADNRKAKEILGFSPAYSSREAFAQVLRERVRILRNLASKSSRGYRLYNFVLKLAIARLERANREDDEADSSWDT